MIRRADELTRETREAWRGGPGRGFMTKLASREEMMDNAKTFGIMEFEPNCGIGIHKHDYEMEVYLILEGYGEYFDNDRNFKVFPGDVCICKSGEQHAITNIGDEPLKIVNLIVMK